jgi:acyl carrier protein
MPSLISAEQVESVIYDALVEIGPSRDQLSRDASFAAIDVDSLDLAELSQVIEEQFGVRLKGDDVASIKTVGEAVDLIVARAG